MFYVRRCFYLVVMFCFLVGPFSFHLWAIEVANEGTSNLQKIETQQEQAPLPKQPRISFDAISYNAGDVWEGDVVSHDFAVKNTGASELTISRVQPG